MILSNIFKVHNASFYITSHHTTVYSPKNHSYPVLLHNTCCPNFSQKFIQPHRQRARDDSPRRCRRCRRCRRGSRRPRCRRRCRRRCRWRPRGTKRGRRSCIKYEVRRGRCCLTGTEPRTGARKMRTRDCHTQGFLCP